MSDDETGTGRTRIIGMMGVSVWVCSRECVRVLGRGTRVVVVVVTVVVEVVDDVEVDVEVDELENNVVVDVFVV